MIAEVVVVCKYTHFLVKAVVIIHFFLFSGCLSIGFFDSWNRFFVLCYDCELS